MHKNTVWVKKIAVFLGWEIVRRLPFPLPFNVERVHIELCVEALFVLWSEGFWPLSLFIVREFAIWHLAKWSKLSADFVGGLIDAVIACHQSGLHQSFRSLSLFAVGEFFIWFLTELSGFQANHVRRSVNLVIECHQNGLRQCFWLLVPELIFVIFNLMSVASCDQE